MSPDATVSVNGSLVEPRERVLAAGPCTLEICAFGDTEVVLLALD